jgi:HemY protein
MMRRTLSLLVLLLLSVGGALWFERQGGFVMVRVGDLTLQSSLFVALAAVVVVWVLAAVVASLVRRLRHVPDRIRGRLGQRRGIRARHELVEGLIELAEGRYALAEKRLESSAGAARLPVFNHLLSALAAQRRGDWKRRDDLLAEADAAEPRARLAVGLVQARLQVEAAQWEQALATLGWLRKEAPRNHRLLALMARALQALEDEAGLEALLPDLRREAVLPDDEMTALEARLLERRLAALGPNAGADALAQVWKALPRARQRDPGLRARYARALIEADCPATAERQLRRWLKDRWASELVEVYGELEMDPPQRAYNPLANWLKERPEDPTLLHAAARQAIRCALWGQARSYLEAATARASDPAIDRLLAELYERLEEPEKARLAYRRALGLAPTLALEGPVKR